MDGQVFLGLFVQFIFLLNTNVDIVMFITQLANDMRGWQLSSRALPIAVYVSVSNLLVNTTLNSEESCQLLAG